MSCTHTIQAHLPDASESQATGGWTLSFEYLTAIQQAMEAKGIQVELETIEAILLYMTQAY